MPENKKPGSILVLVLWIIFFWPVAIVYALIRSWSHNPQPYQMPDQTSSGQATSSNQSEDWDQQ